MERAVHQTPRRGGNVLVRGLLQRLAARDERMPIEHAVAIVISAAAYVHTAHGRGTRVFVSPERILVGFDGSVSVEPATSDPEFDAVTGLGDLLVELLGSQPLPPAVRTVAATVAADRYAFNTAWGFARALSQAARAAELQLSRDALGKWAHRQVFPPKLAHTVQRDIPVLGVDIGTQKPPPNLAIGSGTYEEIDFPDDDFESVTTEGVFEVDVDIDDLLRFDEPTPVPPTPVGPLVTAFRSPPKPPALIVETAEVPAVEVTPIAAIAAPKKRRSGAIAFVIVVVALGGIAAAVGVVEHVESSRANATATLRLATPPRVSAPSTPAAPAATTPVSAPTTIEAPPVVAAISTELAAEVAACQRKTKSTSRRVRAACAIAACRAGDSALHDALVAPLGSARKADVARKCASSDVD